MPRYLAPGVYVEEVSLRTRAIAAAETGTAAFFGPALRGPVGEVSPPLTAFADFERLYGGTGDVRIGASWRINYVAHAVRCFFAEGGRTLHVVRTPAVKNRQSQIPGFEAAFKALDGVPGVSLVAAPGGSQIDPAIAPSLIAHVERPGSCQFAILDFPLGTTASGAQTGVKGVRSRSAAVYHPWIFVTAEGPTRANPTGAELCLPPSGFLAGIYARVDRERGVHKAPANEVIRSAFRFEAPITSSEQEILNPEGVNCLRSRPRKGLVVWGARTTSSDPEWKYVNVRRYFLYLRQSLESGTAWVVFEPNNEPLWASVRSSVDGFLHQEWRRGALMGAKPEEAYFVKCDRSTMTAVDLAAGRLRVMVGVALIRPAEFMVFQIEQRAGV